MDGRAIMRRLDAAASDCATAGKIAAVAYVGPLALVALKAHVKGASTARVRLPAPSASDNEAPSPDVLSYATVPVRLRATLDQHTEGKYHDCRFVDAKNRLIPAAMLEAESSVKLEPSPRRDAVVARVFFAAMQRLAVERGLVSAVTGTEAKEAV